MLQRGQVLAPHHGPGRECRGAPGSHGHRVRRFGIASDSTDSRSDMDLGGEARHSESVVYSQYSHPFASQCLARISSRSARSRGHRAFDAGLHPMRPISDVDRGGEERLSESVSGFVY